MTRGPKASLAKDGNADIMWVIIELLRRRIAFLIRQALEHVQDKEATSSSLFFFLLLLLFFLLLYGIKGRAILCL